jgi:hypothetical protein
MLNANSAWILGPTGQVIYTNDGGSNLTIQNSGTLNGLLCISFADQNHGMAAGHLGTIVKTTDGGANWFPLESGTTNQLSGIVCIDFNNAWVSGREGTILRTTNGGLTFIDVTSNVENPSAFSLKQNYPNPFNPETRIRYSVPASKTGKSIHVRLMIYDLLGREISALVDEFKPAGEYEVIWRPSNLTSGVYIYKIESEDWTKSRKMLYLK